MRFMLFGIVRDLGDTIENEDNLIIGQQNAEVQSRKAKLGDFIAAEMIHVKMRNECCKTSIRIEAESSDGNECRRAAVDEKIVVTTVDEEAGIESAPLPKASPLPRNFNFIREDASFVDSVVIIYMSGYLIDG